MRWIHNPQSTVIEALYDGKRYEFPPNDYQPIEEPAIEHILATRPALKEEKPADGDIRKYLGASAPVVEIKKIDCPFCDKDFTGADNAEKSLKGHIIAVHLSDKTKKDKAEVAEAQ